MLIALLFIVVNLNEEFDENCNKKGFSMGHAVTVFNKEMRDVYFDEDIWVRRCFYFKEQALKGERCIQISISNIDIACFEEEMQKSFPNVKFSWLQKRIVGKEVPNLWIYSKPSLFDRIVIGLRKIFGCKNGYSFICNML